MILRLLYVPYLLSFSSMNIPNDGGWGKSQELSGQGRSGFLGHIGSLSKDWLILACLVLTASLCFGLGLLANRENQPSKDPLWIEQLPPEELPGSVGTSTPARQKVQPRSPAQALPASQPAAAAVAMPQTGQYVASKTGTKYYLPSCATAKRIKDENKVWFATKAAAEAAGYQPSTTCKGL